MKIIFVIKNLNSAVGGAERVFCKITSLLANRGHDISIVTFDKKNTKYFYDLESSINCFNLSIGDSSSKTKLIEYFKRIFALRTLFIKEKPNIIVGFMHSSYIPIAFSLFGLSIPLIASEHTTINYYFKKPLQLSLLLISNLLISRFTVLSSSIKNRYPFFIARKMTIVSNPILNPEVTDLNKKKSLRKILLSVGRLEPSKDHLTLIEAFSVISYQNKDWDLHIIGEGKLRKDIKNKINSLELNNRIFLKGFTKKINYEYQKADIFVMPSKYEAFGLVTAEAMAHYLPCIGFLECPGTNELIIHDVTGILVEGKNNRVLSLAAGLNSLCKNPELRNIYGTNGHQLISEKFSEIKITDLWETLLYNELKNN